MSDYSFGSVRIEITPETVKSYLLHDSALTELFVDDMLKTIPFHVQSFLDGHREDFDEYVIVTAGGGDM